MLFTEPLFLFLFLPLFLAGFEGLSRACGHRFRNPLKLFLVAGTFVFYAWRHEPSWWLPFALVVAFDFLWSRLLSTTIRPGRRRALLCLSLAQNLGVLFVYKYLAWVLGFSFLDGVPGAALVRDAWLDDAGHARVAMPAGISFYLFESMSYVIDVYRGHVRPPRNPLDFVSFIAMFPRMIAGPIVRYAETARQMAVWSGPRLGRGLPLFMLGFVYKALAADSVAALVPAAFSARAPDLFAAWLGAIGYSLQIYFDFAGYSLMAIGLGHALGFQFPTNFANPYAAESIGEFWRRWHITLSTWLRDYLYFPLGGNRRGSRRRDLNLLLTMALGGLWHGANATFVVWGVLHGLLLVTERATERARAACPRSVRRTSTLLLVVVAWTIFRADDLGQARSVLSGMVGGNGLALGAAANLIASHRFSVVVLVAALLYALVLSPRLPAPEDREQWPRPAEFLIAVLFLLAVGVTLSSQLVPFLYYRF